MNKFGSTSRYELSTADVRLENIALKVIRIKDHSILKGHRPEDEQNEAWDYGNTQLRWPDGKHNGAPSKALDVQTYPRPENKQDLKNEQYFLLGLYVGVGEAMGIKLRTGADWDADGEVSDNGWDDLFHVEIVGD